MPRRSTKPFLTTVDKAAVGLFAIILGLAAAGVLSATWPLPGDSGFWGAIFGAIIGGSIALVGQWITVLDSRRARRDEQMARDRAQGSAFLFKLVHAFNGLHNIDRFFRKTFDPERLRGRSGEPWMFYRPASYTPDPVRFTADELSVFVALAPADLTAKCIGLDERYNALLAGIAKLDGLRTALIDTIEPDAASGDVVSGLISPSARQRADMNLINSLVADAQATCAENLRQTREAVIEVNSLLRRKLGLTISVSPQ